VSFFTSPFHLSHDRVWQVVDAHYFIPAASRLVPSAGAGCPGSWWVSRDPPYYSASSSFLPLLHLCTSHESRSVCPRPTLRRTGKSTRRASASARLLAPLLSAIFRPFKMLFVEPILLLATVYLSVAYGVIYASASHHPSRIVVFEA